MNIALVFSGKIRALNKTKKFWSTFVSKYNADVYASFWDEENYKFDDTIDNFIKLYNPKKIDIENNDTFKETTTDILKLYVSAPEIYSPYIRENISNFNILSMYYKIWRGNLLTHEYNKKYDVVIRARTDILFDTNINIVSNGMLNVPVGIIHGGFKNDFGINDCFGYASPKIMNYYSSLFLRIMEYLNAGYHMFPNEHVLLAHLSKIDINIRFFPNYMGIARNEKEDIEWFNSFVKANGMIESVVHSSSLDYIAPNENSQFKVDSIRNKFSV